MHFVLHLIVLDAFISLAYKLQLQSLTMDFRKMYNNKIKTIRKVKKQVKKSKDAKSLLLIVFNGYRLNVCS